LLSPKYISFIPVYYFRYASLHNAYEAYSREEFALHATQFIAYKTNLSKFAEIQKNQWQRIY